MEIRNSLSAHPCLHVFLVLRGPGTAQSTGLSFPFCQEKDLDSRSSEIPLTLIFSGEFVVSVTLIWMFEIPQTLYRSHTKTSQGEENEQDDILC